MGRNGVYVFVERNNNNIKITQDFIGSYGIYVYTSKDYFAISNSFIKLVDYLKHNHHLSLNKDYANALVLRRSLCSFAYESTLINEIKNISRNTSISIDISSKEITYELIDTEENTISVDTKEGLELLDKWFLKWINIIRSLKKKTNNVSFDLTGGFDTRMILALMLASDIDFNSIRVRSLTDSNHSHVEDYEIASEIANYYDFKLNGEFDVDFINFKDISEVLNLSCYTKLGFNNQLNFRFSYSAESIITISGNGGGILRGFPNVPQNDYIRGIITRAHNYDQLLVKSVEKIISEGFKQVTKDIDEDMSASVYYKETRLRNHFGKLTAEHYLHNNIIISPLMDSELWKLKVSSDGYSDIITTLIIVRYCPKLLDFKVEGGREYNSETI